MGFPCMTFAGTTIVIVVLVVSSVVVLVVGIAIGIYIWKHRYIQKKRRGKVANHCTVLTIYIILIISLNNTLVQLAV